jgi:hypothetical protein
MSREANGHVGLKLLKSAVLKNLGRGKLLKWFGKHLPNDWLYQQRFLARLAQFLKMKSHFSLVQFFAFARKLVIFRDQAAYDDFYSQPNDLSLAHWLSDALESGQAFQIELPEETAARPMVEVYMCDGEVYVVHEMPDDDICDRICSSGSYLPLLIQLDPQAISVF